MKSALLSIMVFAAMGCDQSTTVGQCSDEAAIDGLTADGGTGNDKPSDSPEPFADGASCDDGAQCESGYCVPSQNDFGTGVCFSHATVGCVVVTDPSPLKPACASLLKTLYTCGDAIDVTQWSLGCVDVGTGDIGEHYHCCSKPGIP